LICSDQNHLRIPRVLSDRLDRHIGRTAIVEVPGSAAVIRHVQTASRSDEYSHRRIFVRRDREDAAVGFVAGDRSLLPSLSLIQGAVEPALSCGQQTSVSFDVLEAGQVINLTQELYIARG